MAVSPELSARIEALRLAVPRESAELRRIADRFGVLPVYNAIGGCLGLRADGEVISIPVDEDAAHVETDPRWRKVALVCAAKRYPELSELAPKRPESARQCTTCGGTGRLVVTGVSETLRCGECDSTGWLD